MVTFIRRSLLLCSSMVLCLSLGLTVASAASGSVSQVSIVDTYTDDSFSVIYKLNGNEQYYIDFALIKNGGAPTHIKSTYFDAYAFGNGNTRLNFPLREFLPYSSVTYNSSDTFKAQVTLKASNNSTILSTATSSNSIKPDSATVNTSCNPNLHIAGSTISTSANTEATAHTINLGSPRDVSFLINGSTSNVFLGFPQSMNMNFGYLWVDRNVAQFSSAFGYGTYLIQSIAYTNNTSNQLCGYPQYAKVVIPYPTPSFTKSDIRNYSNPNFLKNGVPVISSTLMAVDLAWTNNIAGTSKWYWSENNVTFNQGVSNYLYLSSTTQGNRNIYFKVCNGNQIDCGPVVTKTFFFDTTPPTITESSGLHNSSNNVGPKEVIVSCSDDEVGCSSLGYRITPNSSSCTTSTTMTNTCSDAANCSIPVSETSYICLVASNQSNLKTSKVVSLTYDNLPPSVALKKVTQDENFTIQSNGGIYNIAAGRPVRFDFQTVDSGGIDKTSCSLHDEDLIAIPGASITCDNTESSVSLSALPAGIETLFFSVRDLGGRATTINFQVKADIELPETVEGAEPFSAQVLEKQRILRLTMPSLRDDTGIASVRFLLTSNGVTHPVHQEMLYSEYSYPTVVDGVAQINMTPSRTVAPGGNMYIWGLPATNEDGSQKTYTIEYLVTDITGKTSSVATIAERRITNLNFDTLAPEISSISRPGMGIRNGTGSSGTPYLVGTSKDLALRFSLMEYSNKYNSEKSTPLTIRHEAKDMNGNIVPMFALLPDALPSGSEGPVAVAPRGDGEHAPTPIPVEVSHCQSLDATGACFPLLHFVIPENFVGSIDVMAADAGGNLSAKQTLWVKQDSNKPRLTEDFSLTTEIGENTPYKGTFYEFAVDGVDKNGTDKTLYASIRYMKAGTTEETTLSGIELIPQDNGSYRFGAYLEGVAYGQQDIMIAFEDNYGNKHDGGAVGIGEFIDYGIFHDNLAPEIEGFRFSWSDNSVIVHLESIADDAFPVRARVEGSTNGTTWTDRGAVNTWTQESETNNSSFTISDVQAGEQIRIIFEDTVRDYQDGRYTSGANPRMDYTDAISREMLLTVTEESGSEQLRVAFTPEEGADISTFASYNVSYTGPHGRSGSFPAITSFSGSGGLLGYIESPLKTVPGSSEYRFNITLNYTAASGKTPLESSKTYQQLTDIVTPKATLSVVTVPEIVTYSESKSAYIMRSSAPDLNISYQIALQSITGSIFDDSLPLEIRIDGADEPSVASIRPSGTSTFSGTTGVRLYDEKTYNLRATISDGAGRSVVRNFTIIRDTGAPAVSIQFASVDGEQQLALVSNESTTERITLTKTDQVYMDVIVSNETAPVTWSLPIGLEATEVSSLSGLTEGQQGKRYLLQNIAEGSVQNVEISIQDQAGWVEKASAKLRRDTTAPALVSGDVSLQGNILSEGIIPLTATFQDFSRVDYITVLNGERQEARVYTDHIVVADGTYESLHVIFVDQLGNETPPYTLTTDGTEIIIDTVAPTGTLLFVPATGTIKEPTVKLTSSSVVDQSPELLWEVSRNGTSVSSGRLMEAQYSSAELGDIPLEQNKDNTLIATLKDPAGHTLTSESITVRHDGIAPEVLFDSGQKLADGSISWTFRVGDEGSSVSAVSARWKSMSSGFHGPWSDVAPTDSVYSFTTNTGLIKGQSYALEVLATDSVENSAIRISERVTIDIDEISVEDPLTQPIEIPEDITGDILKVTIDNGALGTIRYVAENLPKGENLYIQDVLREGENLAAATGEARKLEKLPVGTYTITIEDNQGNRTIIYPYIVSPYYLDEDADVNGDGFGGGISDHKLLLQKEWHSVSEDARVAIQTRVDAMKTIIANNIKNRMSFFLSH